MFNVGKIALVIATTIESEISFFRMSNAIQLIFHAHAVCQYERADTIYRSFRDVSMILEFIVTQIVKRYFFQIGLMERLIEFCDQVNCHLLRLETFSMLIICSVYISHFSLQLKLRNISQVNAHSCRNLHSLNFSFLL